MTLDEAIQHCREKVEEQKQEAESKRPQRLREAFAEYQKEYEDCLECARDHEQLARWLEELREVRLTCEHWNDKSNSFVAACEAFEHILNVFGLGVSTGGSDDVRSES